jgi:hypothetical protein
VADQSRLTWALILSLLLHGILLSMLTILRAAPLNFATPKFVDVDVLPLPAPKPAAPPPPPAPPAPRAQPAPPPPKPIERPQIVSPPEAGEEKEPENTRLLSDRNNRVQQEQIKRGEPLPADPDAKAKPPQPVVEAKPEKPEPPPPKPQEHAAAKPQAAPAPKARARAPEHAARRAAPPPEQLAALPKIDQLLPSAGDLIREGVIKPEEGPAADAGKDGREQAPTGDQQASIQRNDLLRHGDPWRKGSGGSLDFLPSIRDGDISMLNTKADQFAPFVRRVAVRVFETFWIQLRRSIGRGMTDSIEEGAVVEAVMDRKGQLIDFKTKERAFNGTLATDRNLQSSVQQAFFDRNPPSGAEANDGNIHFLFEVKVSLIADPGRGVVGYRALMGAGLL